MRLGGGRGEGRGGEGRGGEGRGGFKPDSPSPNGSSKLGGVLVHIKLHESTKPNSPSP